MNNYCIKIPTLVYHYITESDRIKPEKEEEFYSVTVSNFKRQLEYLNNRGYIGISLDDLIEAKEGYKKLPKKPIILTFDDGHISNYELAYPLLNNYMFKAIFFIVTENIGSRDFMSWSDLKEVSKDGILIGSHTATHRFLSKLNNYEIEKELKDSKSALEDELGKEVKFLSIPGGFYNQHIRKIARDSGYQAICTSDFGLNYLDSDLFSLKRIGIRYDTKIEDFKKLFKPNNLSLSSKKISWSIKYILKNIIGIDNYTMLKEYVIRRRS